MWCDHLTCMCEIAVQLGHIGPLIAKQQALSAETRRDIIQRQGKAPSSALCFLRNISIERWDRCETAFKMESIKRLMQYSVVATAYFTACSVLMRSYKLL